MKLGKIYEEYSHAQGGGVSRLSRTSNINPCDWTKKMAKPVSGCVATAQACESKTGRWRNWTMPPLRPERECREWPNSATIDNRCEEFDRRENKREAAFTMAEILLSLTIIGVVAAITLPSLTGNINERTWNTQRKALYARMSQAVALMPALNGYGVLEEGDPNNVAEVFVTNGLAKVLKINNICDDTHLSDCGIPSKITAMDASVIEPFPATFESLNSKVINVPAWTVDDTWTYSYAQTDTKAAAFETANGESIAVYYNPRCSNDLQRRDMTQVHFMQKYLCANFIYDLNGTKGPNTVGKDIGFISVINPSDPSVVAPMPLTRDTAEVAHSEAIGAWKGLDSESRFPNIEEMTSMFVNKNLWGADENNYWTSTRYSAQYAYYFSMRNGHSAITPIDAIVPVRCIKR